MTTSTQQKADNSEVSIEDKLRALYSLQSIDSKTDEIHRLCGELPLEVQDLEDELVGLETRIAKIETEITACQSEIAKRKNDIVAAKEAIKKYQTQQLQVRNNREYDSISKEIEFQNLEINLCEKKIKEAETQLTTKKNLLKDSKDRHEDRQKDLVRSKAELESIIADTQKDEQVLKSNAAFTLKKSKTVFLTLIREYAARLKTVLLSFPYKETRAAAVSTRYRLRDNLTWLLTKKSSFASTAEES